MISSATNMIAKMSFLGCLLLLLIGLCGTNAFSQTATNGDYRSAATGNWGTAATWQVRTAGSWAAASTPPTASNNVYIQSGHTVTVNVATASCNDFHQHTAGVTAIGANTLQVSGKIRAYTGTAVTTTGADGTFYTGQTSSTSPGATSITTTGAGKLSFIGSTRSLTLTGEWGANLTGAAFEVALTSGQTGTLNTNVKAASWNIASGIVDANTRNISADNGTTGGNITVASGATILSSGGKLFQRTASGLAGTVTVNGSINFSGAAPSIQATTVIFNGTIEYSAAGAQTFVVAAGAGAGDPTSYTNIILSGSGLKTTAALKTTTIAAGGSLTVSGGATPATFAIGAGGAFSVSGTGTTLSYTASGAQTTGPEWVSTFQNLVVNNAAGITLDVSKSVNGTLTFTSGTVTTGANVLTLGASGTVSRTSGHVIGNFAKNFAIDDQPATTFEVGTSSAYTPVTLDLDGTGGTVGTFTASTTGSSHSAIASSGLNTSKDIDRYWTVAPGTGTLGARTYKLKVEFLPGDVTGGADPNAFEFRKYDGSWTTPSGGTYTRTGTSTQYSNFTSFSDFAVGEVAAVNASDMIENLAFTYPTNINYAANTGTDVTSANPEVFEFIIRDGGGSPDADALNTTLTDVTFAVVNSSVLEHVALYDGTTELQEVAAGATITFTGLSATALDNGSKTLNLRATYKTAVTDNTLFSFAVTSATASGAGSGFATGNAGGASSSTAGDNNRIEVTASELDFTTQPSTSATVGVALATQPVVTARDANGNTDLDYTGVVTLTNSGVLPTVNDAVAAVAGTATYSGYRFNATGAGITLSTSNGDGLTNAPASNAITITCPTITLAPGSPLTDGTIGAAYSQTITASGGTSPYSFAVTAGALPAGLTLAADGALTGTPTVTGAFGFTVTATDTFGCTGNLAYSLNIVCPTITLAPPTLPDGTTGSAYSQTITASGGAGAYVFTLSSGALPAGVTLASGGGLTGTPTVSGAFNFTVRATDENGCSDSLAYVLTVNCPTITLSPGTLPNGLNGVAYNHSVSASGGVPPYTYTSDGILPTGLTLSSGGDLAGTPSENGAFVFHIVATDANGCADSLEYTINVASCPVITAGPAFPDGSVGASYSHTITASGGVSPYTFTLSGGTIPPGLTFTTDQLSGTPTTPGKFAFAITVHDSNQCAINFYDTVIVCGTVALAPSSPLTAGTAGAAYSATISASGSSGPYTFAVTSGALPTGLSLATDGSLTGTPLVTGVFSFTVTATDTNGCTGSLPYSLTVNCPTITLAPPTLPGGTTGVAYSQTITASGGLGSYTFSLSSGSVPTGLTLASGGALTGTPTVAGIYNFTVRATDGIGCSDSLAYSVTISCPAITVNPASLPNGFLSSLYSTSLSATGGTAPYTFSNTGSLPTGLTLSAGGTISGTPTVAGKYVFTAIATDANGCTGSRLDSITIFGAAVTSIATGNWNAGTTWDQGAKPGPTQNVVIAAGHTVTLTANDTCATVTVNSSGVLDIGTFKLGLSGTYTLLAGGEGRQGAFNPVPGGGATPWTFDVASTYTLNGAATGFSIGAATGITFGNMNWNSTANGTPPVGTVIAGNLTLGGSGEMRGGTGAVTSRIVTVLGNAVINSGTMVVSNSDSSFTSGGFDISGNLTINALGTLRGVNRSGPGFLKIGGSLVNNGGKIRVNNGGFGAGNWTTYFKGTGAGNFNPGDSSAFRTVAIAPGRSITLQDTLLTTSTFTVRDSGALFCGTNTIAGTGGFTLVSGGILGTGHPAGISTTTGGGTIQVTGARTFPPFGMGEYVYNGAVAQSATDSTLFSAANLTINNSAGVTFVNNFYVSNQLTLQNGNVTFLGGKVMSIGSAASVSRTSGHIIGKLSKNFGTGASVANTFEVGDATAYTPVDLTLHTVTGADSLTVSTTGGEHPNLATSGIQATKDVNRYFTVANGGTVFASADATFHFAAGDVDGAANTANFGIGKYNAPNWTYPAVGTRTATSTQTTGLTSFSDFAIGEILSHTITVTQGANGLIAPGTTVVVDNSTQAFSITPNPGFIVDSVFADGVYNPDSTTSYTFKNVTANHTLTAKFIQSTFTLSVVQGANGAIAPGTSVVAAHATKAFSITPSAGHHLDSVMVDGAKVDSTTSYTFKNVRANHSITAHFSIDTFTLTVVQGANGVIAPGTTVVPLGASQAFSITPATGYHLDSVMVDGGKVDSTTSYTFKNVAADHSITAHFTINSYALNVAIVGSGSVAKAPDQPTYAHGSLVSLTPSAPIGWSFFGWSGDATGNANPLSVSMTSAKNITATFLLDSSYLAAYRSFAPESIAVDKDNKGKIGKFIQRKPDKVEFKFLMVGPPSQSISTLILKFSMFTTGSITRGVTKVDTLLSWTAAKEVTPLLQNVFAGDTIQVEGHGLKGKRIKVTYDWATNLGHVKGTVANYLENQPQLPMPNRVNALFETFLQGGFAPTLGLLVGKDRTADSSKQYGWLLAPKYGDVLKTLYVGKTGAQHNGKAQGFDRFLSGKALVKRQKSIPPSKFNDRLLANMVAVKFGIAASAMGKTPAGFGELIYNDGSANPLNGRMVKEIAAIGDSVMMGYYSFGIHTFLDSTVFNTLDSTLNKINDAFEGPVDTIDFASKLHMKGVRDILSVPYMRPGTSAPAKIVPLDVPLYETPVAYRLEQNYPNPFNPATTISFDLPQTSIVTLKVYNMLGQQVAALLDNQQLEDGTQEVTFDASSLATGVYFYRLSAQGVADPEEGTAGQLYVSVKKMMLLK